MPGRSVVLTINDVHVPHQDNRALKLIVSAAEDNGCTHVVANGDLHDCGVGSRHPSKKARDTIQWGTLGKSTKAGDWLWKWIRSKRAFWLRGNHEKWVEDKIAEDPALAEVQPEDLLGLPRNGEGWEVLPSNSRLRLGSFVWEHGHGIFPKGNGGQNPAARIKSAAPHQVTFIGHLHRNFRAWWTMPDERGVDRVYGAMGNGHLSLPQSHEDYAGGYPGWQQSASLHYVYELGGRPRMTVDQIVILRDHRDRPYFEYRGRLYR